jgi:hypothetical protein
MDITHYQALLAEIAALKPWLADSAAPYVPATPSSPALDTLVQGFGLSPLERQVLVLCAGVELDAECVAFLQQVSGQPYPTLSLLLNQLGEEVSMLLAPDAPLRMWQLVDVEGSSLLNSALGLSAWTLNYLLGRQALNSGLIPLLIPVTPDDTRVPPSYQALLEQVGDKPIQLTNKKTYSLLTQAIAAQRQQSLYHVAWAAILEAAIPDRLYYSRLLIREALVRPLLYSMNLDNLDNQAILKLMPLLHLFYTYLPAGFIVLSAQSLALPFNVTTPYIGYPLQAEQLALWQVALEGLQDKTNLDATLTQLMLAYRCYPEEIAAIAAAIVRQQPTQTDLLGALWQQCSWVQGPSLVTLNLLEAS